jgi:hypothetical protein
MFRNNSRLSIIGVVQEVKIIGVHLNVTTLLQGINVIFVLLPLNLLLKAFDEKLEFVIFSLKRFNLDF